MLTIGSFPVKSVVGGESLIPYFTQVIYLWVPWKTRKQRLERLELERDGREALATGGEMHAVNEAFMAWASRYDTAGMEQRSRVSHEHWLAELPEQIQLIRVEEELDPQQITDQVIRVLHQHE